MGHGKILNKILQIQISYTLCISHFAFLTRIYCSHIPISINTVDPATLYIMEQPASPAQFSRKEPNFMDQYLNIRSMPIMHNL